MERVVLYDLDTLLYTHNFLCNLVKSETRRLSPPSLPHWDSSLKQPPGVAIFFVLSTLS